MESGLGLQVFTHAKQLRNVGRKLKESHSKRGNIWHVPGCLQSSFEMKCYTNMELWKETKNALVRLEKFFKENARPVAESKGGFSCRQSSTTPL